jgi:hypothetical protein
MDDIEFFNEIPEHINKLIVKRRLNMMKLYQNGIMPDSPEYMKEYEVDSELVCLQDWILRRGKPYFNQDLGF